MGLDEIGITSGLVGYWKFDNNAIDWTENKLTPTMNGTAYSTDSVRGTHSVYFDADTDNIDFNDNLETNSFTLSLAIKLIDRGGRHLVWVKWTGYTLEPVDAGSSWKWSGGLYTTSGQEMFTPTDTFNWNQWYHIAFTFDETTLIGKAYVDGEYLGQNTFTSVPQYSSADSKIGNDGYGGMQGYVDEARYYNRALSDQEIKALYNVSGVATTKASVDKYGIWRTIELSELGITDDLVGYWKFNGDVLDWSGDNDGSIGGTPSYVAGIKGQALDFNGSTDYVEIASNSDLDVGDGPHTISALIYMDANEVGDIMGKGGTSLQGSYLLMVYTASYVLRGHIWTDTSSNTLDGVTSLNDSSWHYVAQVVDGSNIYVYVDGEEDNSAALVGSLGSRGATTSFIGSRSVSSDFFNGKIDDVRVYDKALSAQEIKLMYNYYLNNGRMQLSDDGKTYISGELKEV